MSLTPDNPDIPDEYLLEIGRVAVKWNRLESSLVHTMILALLGDWSEDGRALAILAHTSFPQKLDGLSAILRIINPELATVYREQVQGKLKEAQEKRNAIIHQSWFSQVDGVKRFSVAARGTLKLTLQSVDAQELRDASRIIDDAESALLTLVTFPLAPKS